MQRHDWLNEQVAEAIGERDTAREEASYWRARAEVVEEAVLRARDLTAAEDGHGFDAASVIDALASWVEALEEGETTSRWTPGELPRCLYVISADVLTSTQIAALAIELKAAHNAHNAIVNQPYLTSHSARYQQRYPEDTAEHELTADHYRVEADRDHRVIGFQHGDEVELMPSSVITEYEDPGRPGSMYYEWVDGPDDGPGVQFEVWDDGEGWVFYGGGGQDYGEGCGPGEEGRRAALQRLHENGPGWVYVARVEGT